MKRNLKVSQIAGLLFSLFVGVITPVLAASGSLDTSFNGFISNAARLNDVAIQSDGKILVSAFVEARINNTLRYDFVRLNPDGSFDSTFNSVITYSSGTTDYYVGKIIIQPEGKVCQRAGF